jgi:2'-hydroxyisoflavone reductase
VTMAGLLETCRRVAGSDANLIWVDERFLLSEGAGPWMELPLWLPGAETALLQADVSRAVAAGLAFRPLEETVRDTLHWARSGEDLEPLVSGETGEAGMRPEREKELLGAWGAKT